MSKSSYLLTLTLVSISAAWWGLAPSCLQASDHLDAPNLSGDDDINDLYAFQSPSNRDNTVLILTTNPFAGQMSGTAFGTDVTYQLQIDNDADTIADLTYSTTFAADAGGGQAYTTTLNGNPYLTGTTGGTSSANAGGSMIQVGTFDDPFFFDLVGFRNTLDPNSAASFTGDDTFAGANVSAIVLEVPSSELNGPNIGVWARTLVGGNQVDRAGRPAINTVLIPSARKQEFNEAAPADDLTNFAANVEATIETLNGGDSATATGLTNTLLPDVLTFDTSSSAGFLNGRRLADDVIDAALGLLTNNAITGDGVAANDTPFLDAFPYLAPANAIIPEPASFVLGILGWTAMTCCRRNRTLFLSSRRP